MCISLTNKQILEHLEVIDSHLHMPYSDFYMPPAMAQMTIDEIARCMIMHVGLYGYEPVIEYDRLVKGVGGYVELNNNRDKIIRITLSDDLTIAKEAKLSTLAHEICHKLLYIHNCYFPDMGDYNESLTDIATIYVGFGKLTLNGCLVITPNHKRTSGYLDIEQYATAYRIVCHINDIAKEDYEAGLDAEALPVLLDNDRIKQLDDQLPNLNEALHQYRISHYAEDAAMMSKVVVLEAAVKKMKEEITARQKRDIEVMGVADNRKGEIINPYRVLLHTIDDVVDISTNESESFSLRLKQLLKDDGIQNVTFSITCPVCGFHKENALTEHKKSLIRCPKCKHVFYWDSSIPADSNDNRLYGL